MDVAGLNNVIAGRLMKTSREAAVCSLQKNNETNETHCVCACV